MLMHAYQKPLKGKTIGVVFGGFAPLHQGHLDVIMRAKKENDGGCLLFVCGSNNDRGSTLMPIQKRYRYTRDLFAKDPLVAVYGINESELGIPDYPNGWDTYLEEIDRVWKYAVAQDSQDAKAIWYVSEPEYKEALESRGQTVILLDRTQNPISATMIRQNPIKYWDKIAMPFRRVFSTNILVMGTASEGKTTLVEDLGRYFNAPFSHEWARIYMEESCVGDWELDGVDYLAFLEGQYNLNKKLINSAANQGIFFADTDSMVTSMYAKYYMLDKDFSLTEEEYNKVLTVADEYTSKSRWDKIFVLGPKNTFVDDNQRYMAHGTDEARKELFDILIEELERSGNLDKAVFLTGSFYENFLSIVNYVKELIENGKNGQGL